MCLFTPEDLLEYYYHETSPEKTNAIQLALETNWALQQKYKVLCDATTRLDKAIQSPRTKAVNAILDYATAHLPAQLH
jgi:hypothetical protein